jgi:hypothetical protein
MQLLWRLLGGYFVRRLVEGRRRGRRSSWSHGPRRRGRARFVGPFPRYSTRTRGGSRVTVTGCCLPIPLALAIGALLGARALVRR